MGDIYAETLRIEQCIKAMAPTCGYRSIWGCKFKQMLIEDSEANEFVKNIRMGDAVNLKDALYGGRCENFCSLSNSSEDSKIMHYDVVSMYPAVQYTKKFPLGHPVIHTEQFPDDLSTCPYLYKGFIKCEIDPPYGLFVPVLPCRLNNKLHFSLCKTCSVENQQTKCDHTKSERLLTGVWSTAELQVALEKGYIISHIFEIWAWSSWSDDVFKDYIRTFYKIKVCASGFPSWCKSREDKEMYIAELNQREGLSLAINDIEYNKGLRTVSKVVLVSLWGKLGESLEHTQVKYTCKVSDLTSLMSNKMETLKDVTVINDDCIRLQYSTNVQNVTAKNFQNIAIASLVTSYGRLHIYEQLTLLNRRLCYTDTDSCVFLLQTNDPILNDLNLGHSLGKMVSELGAEEHITRFICMGPKAYAYECNTGRKKMCMKGIPQKICTDDVLTLDNMSQRVMEYCSGQSEGIKIIYPYKIWKDSKTGVVISSPLLKTWRAVIDKRVLDKESNLTYPFGY